MKGLSKKEIEIVSDLEFKQKYYFTNKDIAKHFNNETHRKNIIYNLKKKGRIKKINRSKYYLIPIKARYGKWIDHPFIAVDEICDGKDYFIGGYASANYWRLTNQIPAQVDVYTTRRQGIIRIFNKRIVFHRTSIKNLKKGITKKIENHDFIILNKKESEKWIKSKE